MTTKMAVLFISTVTCTSFVDVRKIVGERVIFFFRGNGVQFKALFVVGT
jgi:hypothetical protein